MGLPKAFDQGRTDLSGLGSEERNLPLAFRVLDDLIPCDSSGFRRFRSPIDSAERALARHLPLIDLRGSGKKNHHAKSASCGKQPLKPSLAF